MTASGRTDQVATFVAGADAKGVDAAALAAAVPPIVDTIGVMLAGRAADAGAAVLDYIRSAAVPAGGSWVAGLSGGVPSEFAAMANGTLGHALDYDDSLPGSGHPSAIVLAGILGVADGPGATLSGRDLAAAYVVGFEVMARLAKAFGRGHTMRGWHVTGTAGAFGATAGAARVLDLDADRTRVALGIAGSLSSGMLRNFGTTTKPLHSGLAARAGVLAARLAQLGGTAATDILDGERGYLDLYGAGEERPEHLDALGAPYALLDPGTALKKYPCCYAAARPIDAVLRLRAENGLRPDDVAEIVCLVPTGGMHVMPYHVAEDAHQAKFCMEYLLAAALTDGHVTVTSLNDDAVRRPAVQALAGRVVARDEPRLRPEDPMGARSSAATGGWVEVAVRRTDGRTLTAIQRDAHGGPRNPMSDDDVAEKFHSCAAFGGYPGAAADELLDVLRGLLDRTDVLAPLRRMTPAPASHRTASEGR